MNLQQYKDITKQLESVTTDLKYGNPIKHKQLLKNISIAKSIINIAYNFGVTKELNEVNKSSFDLLSHYEKAIIDRYNKIHNI